MPIYQSCIYRQNLHTYHMLFIHGNNIKISSHGLINNSTSNGLYTIIFHIIHTSMLTHQLACINISFSNTHFKPFNSTITILLSFTHHSCSSCQATTHKQFHMDHFGSTTIRTVFLIVPIEQWAIRGQPSHQTSVPLCGTEIHGHFRPNNTQTII